MKIKLPLIIFDRSNWIYIYLDSWYFFQLEQESLYFRIINEDYVVKTYWYMLQDMIIFCDIYAQIKTYHCYRLPRWPTSPHHQCQVRGTLVCIRLNLSISCFLTSIEQFSRFTMHSTTTWNTKCNYKLYAVHAGFYQICSEILVLHTGKMFGWINVTMNETNESCWSWRIQKCDSYKPNLVLRTRNSGFLQSKTRPIHSLSR